jgi:hypothetical protein
MTPDGPNSQTSMSDTGVPTPVSSERSGDRFVWQSIVGAGVVAGVISGVIGEWVGGADTMKIVSEFEVAGNVQLAQRAALVTSKSILSYGVLGAVLGLALGLTGGLSRRSVRGSVVGSIVGLVLGGAAGAGAARLFVPLFLKNENTAVADDLILPLLTHWAIWCPIGLAAGLALGVGLGGSRGRLIAAAGGGLIGAAVATGLYETFGAILFPLDRTGQPLAEGAGGRFLAHVLVATGTALVVALAVRSAQRKPVAVERHPSVPKPQGSPVQT